MKANKRLGQNIQRLLIDRGLKAASLAREAQLNPGHLSRIINGEAYPSIEGLHRIACVLGVTPGTLLDGAPNQGEIPDLEIDSTAAVALRCFKKLSAEDKKQLTWIIQRYAQSANP